MSADFWNWPQAPAWNCFGTDACTPLAVTKRTMVALM
jgi:hypothetical protein